MIRPILPALAALALLLPAGAAAMVVDPLARAAVPVAREWRLAAGASLDEIALAGPDGGAVEVLAQGIGGGKSRPDEPEEPEKTPDARLPKPEGHRSPVTAALLSLAIPGAGQFYNGSNSGYIFLGIEAAGWLSWASLRNTGNDIEERYKGYADRHWTWERYRDPNSGGCPPEGHSDGGIQDSTLAYLYEERPDDFYEDIGKLDIYSCGWDSQTNRNEYQEMRDDSNDFKAGSRYALTVVFLNHLISAVHAARGAARTNARLAAGTDLGFHLSPSLVNPSARLTLSHRF